MSDYTVRLVSPDNYGVFLGNRRFNSGWHNTVASAERFLLAYLCRKIHRAERTLETYKNAHSGVVDDIEYRKKHARFGGNKS